MSIPDFALVPPREEPTDVVRVLATCHALTHEMDALAEQIARFVTERAHIVDVLRTFYYSDISISTLTPLLDLCVELGVVTKPEPR